MIRILGPIAILLSMTGCRKTDNVPTYIDIPAVSVVATEQEGGSTSKITDVWVTIDERSVGVWELPARVPVIGDGPHSIGVTAGVKRNGAFDDRLRYPYYTIWRGTVQLAPASSAAVEPAVRYEASTIWSERFNLAGSQLLTSDRSDTALILISPTARPEAVLDGTQIGGFVLDSEHPLVALETDENFPTVFGPAYLELDYSTDIDLTIGLTYRADGITRYEPWVILVPTAPVGGIRWNKVYVDLSEYFNRTGISARDIYIGAQLSGGRISAAGYLDNLKIVRPAS
ncbi:MAG: hypothetical protein KF797_09075 [Flavobacteriales bacterium]|nr:hypothetical protein [Flavobacteriales bacterium]